MMEDKGAHDSPAVNPTSGSDGINESNRQEAVRSRWTPKPEQITILESIFNSGMVNPSKDETVRIRKLIEKFGSVGDANVFYWFQNRRSRSRRRQRQIQAAQATIAGQSNDGAIIRSDPIWPTSSGCLGSSSSSSSSTPFRVPSPSSSYIFMTSPSHHHHHPYDGGGIIEDGGNDLFSISQQIGAAKMEQTQGIISPQMGLTETEQMQSFWPSINPNSHSHSGFITVFINGVASEIPKGPLDIRAMFGQDVILMHSSGEPVPINEHGISTQSLQSGDHYFLLQRSVYVMVHSNFTSALRVARHT